jgi:hypothetical protein
LSEIELIGSNAVKKLRENKLQKGLPFMINSKNLPSNQAYLEYPNGSIAIVQIYKSAQDFTVIKELDIYEVSKIRTWYNLSK